LADSPKKRDTKTGTGLSGEANVGGCWAVHFKRAGFDGIIIKGKAEVLLGDSCAYRGWSGDDIPTKEKLPELGLK